MKLQDRIQKELQRFINRVLKRFDLEAPQDTPQPPETQNTPPTGQGIAGSQEQSPSQHPQMSDPQERLEWRFGGFNGGKAKVDQSVTLSSVKVKGDTISYAWKGKVPSSWSRRSTEKGNLLVFAVFVKQGDGWVGGKIDWTDENRTSRSIENIRGGYGGWNPSLWDSAGEIGICVASEDGKFRSALSTARK